MTSVTFVPHVTLATCVTQLSKAEPRVPIYSEREPNKLVALIRRLKKQHEFIVCDTEGSYGFVGTLLPSLADLAIVPLQPSEADVDELDKALFHIQVAQASKGTPHAVLVLSMTAPNDAKSNRLRSLLNSTAMPIAKQTIRRLNATRDVAKRGVVTRGHTSHSQNAASDFERLFFELLQDRLPRRRKRVGNG